VLRVLFTLLLGCLLSTHLLAADPAPAEEQPAEPAPVLQGGLLGALADGLDSACAPTAPPTRWSAWSIAIPDTIPGTWQVIFCC